MIVGMSIFGVPTTDEGESREYHPPPRSDAKDAKRYADRGMLGSYAPSRDPYMPPDDVRYQAGYGGDEATLRRGYVEPEIRELPEYQLRTYKYGQKRKGFLDSTPDDNYRR